MKKNFRLVVQYDGTEYYGFSRQPEVRTIQGELERSLKELTGEEVVVYGSGRTDAGVHALGQVVNFRSTTRIPAEKMPEALNAFLPKDIQALKAMEVEDGFHARKSAKQKRYVYTVFNGARVPYNLVRFVYHEKRPLSLAEMKETMASLVGEHDFWSFTARISKEENTVRKIFEAEIKERKFKGFGRTFEFAFVGSGFLYRMVRRLSAAVVGAGLGRMPVSDARKALKVKDRRLVPGTLP
ncbi:MAG: tRNA pseudouridine(38-40) synthase TruA, partial [Candidatus Margulisbacteria bacterium]|nr:tRNA pseudouridine(38-40) synthase TruA [Candidatus Margulisiibacteriota bacterium]